MADTVPDLLLSQLRQAKDDIDFAHLCADWLLKKGWHSNPWERRGRTYFHQTAYVTALVIHYARPFTNNRRWTHRLFEPIIQKLPPNLAALHKQILRSRNRIYAHSDGDLHNARPIKVGNFTLTISTTPVYRYTAKELEDFKSLATYLRTELRGIAKNQYPGISL